MGAQTDPLFYISEPGYWRISEEGALNLRKYLLKGGFLIFDDFEEIYVRHPSVDVEPRYMAVFGDNDPAKRVMVLANHNSDLAEYWEWSASGLFAVDPTNDAYRLGVNYIIYGLTH